MSRTAKKYKSKAKPQDTEKKVRGSYTSDITKTTNQKTKDAKPNN
jgi:hypothetical protein